MSNAYPYSAFLGNRKIFRSVSNVQQEVVENFIW